MMSFMTSFISIARAIGMGRPLPGRRNHGLARDCRGVAAVEFGILLPFMVVLLAGIADLGRSIWQYHALSKGVWDATRYLSRVDTPFTAAQLTAAKNLALRGSLDTSRPIQFAHWASSVTINVDNPSTPDPGTGETLVTGYDNTACTLRGPCVNAAAANGIKVITVIATVNPPAGEFPLMSAFGLGAVQYKARHQARKIGE
jgi:Flp pilus assembly protein TadG